MDHITIGNGQKIKISNEGQGILATPSRKLILSKGLHAQNLAHNLLSVNKLTCDNNCVVAFDDNGYVIKDLKINHKLHHGSRFNGLYPLHSSPPISSTAHGFSTINNTSSIWHQWLGNPTSSTLPLIKKSIPFLNSILKIMLCNICNVTKNHHLPFSKSTSCTSSPLQQIHIDVGEPSSIVSSSGFKYYVSFIDDWSRFT